MQRPGETQEEHSFELMTNVDGAHVYMNAGSEGSASENPKPVLMRTTTGKNDNENASKERPVQDVGGAVYSEVTANSNSVIIQGAEQASWRLLERIGCSARLTKCHNAGNATANELQVSSYDVSDDFASCDNSFDCSSERGLHSEDIEA